ncbi:hypothetical protein TTRE_0000405701 [Trichuris trichiura]|uniref:Uncharacterized protein n=1 Tax=Trichuris trichiura TaxID=36087 RepID=A0A077Z7N4_TRITR|nr:hypothetical protein TTRE_0000405701 [Trichuris trichiura]
MPNYLRMAMVSHEVGSVATDLSALQNSRLYEPLNRSFVEEELLKIYDEIDQLIHVIIDYSRRQPLLGARKVDENRLSDIQFKIRPLLERLDEDIGRMDKKVYRNLNCCKIKESRVCWLLNSHKMLKQFGDIVANVTVGVLQPLEEAISLRLRGCDVPFVDKGIDETLMSAGKHLSDIDLLLKQKVFSLP